MKTAIYTKYGSAEVIKIKEVQKPNPKEDEIRVKVHAASVTAADMMMRKGEPKYGRLFIGLFSPKNAIPGAGFAGVIDAVGAEVNTHQVGDKVFGEVIFTTGTNAEYVCVPSSGLIFTLPGEMSFSEAACICDGALTSINFLRNIANIEAGQKVLINGASGSLGTAAVQLSKHYGFNVTGMCSASNVELVCSLGADKVIDYTNESLNDSNEQFDVIYDTVGKLPFSECKASLNANGVYLSPVLSMANLYQMAKTSILGNKRVRFSATGLLPIAKQKELMSELIHIINSGKLKTVLDRSFGLNEIVKAHKYVETGHKIGNVTLGIQPS